MNAPQAPRHAAALAALRQDQFLTILSREEAWARFRGAVSTGPRGFDEVPLDAALGRVLAHDLVAPHDVPGFDRSMVDGIAVRSADLRSASAARPATLRLQAEILACGVVPRETVAPGTATVIATGGRLPRGADAVVMVEHTDPAADGSVLVRRSGAPGAMVAFAGSDIARGEMLLRAGTPIGSREIGILAASGIGRVSVVRRPRVAVLSTGDELLAPGVAPGPASVFDTNGPMLAAAVEEAGATALRRGIVADDDTAIAAALAEALREADMVLLSGGTSKGAGDRTHRILAALPPPGVLCHGVALKPGKPLCLAVGGQVPVLVLPGFPTSAIFTFHAFANPVLRDWAGLSDDPEEHVAARLATTLPSELGRTEYAMVQLAEGKSGLDAWPVGKGSGSVSAFATADGFVAVDALSDGLAEGEAVTVVRIGRASRTPDLVVVGSNCVGLDWLAARLAREGIVARVLAAGSTAGLEAAARGACDLAPIHLLDPASGLYNRPLLPDGVLLVEGWRRLQGVAFRSDDPRFAGCADAGQVVAAALADPDCTMVNRNRGSGTRILLDGLLAGARPPGFTLQPRSHAAVAAAIVQGRADWGVVIETVARASRLGFVPLGPEHYDFALPAARAGRAAVQRFRAVLEEPATREALRELGFERG